MKSTLLLLDLSICSLWMLSLLGGRDGWFYPAFAFSVLGVMMRFVASFSLYYQEKRSWLPLGIFAFLLVGLCTSVMWGAIFNMAVEGLGKYTAVASGIFMTMVFGCAVMMPLQGWVADLTDWITSFWVVFGCAAYILFYALVGSRVSKRAE